MKARDAMSLTKRATAASNDRPAVDAGRHLLEVLPILLDTPGRELGVKEEGRLIGVIDGDSMLEALSRQISPRYDCSVIELSCTPPDYSASLLARAVEDTDTHLVDLITNPGDEGLLNVTLRVRCDDPTAASHSLERYGYHVENVYSHDGADLTASYERLLALQTMINV